MPVQLPLQSARPQADDPSIFVLALIGAALLIGLVVGRSLALAVNRHAGLS
jgi:hypothetical protein